MINNRRGLEVLPMMPTRASTYWWSRTKMSGRRRPHMMWRRCWPKMPGWRRWPSYMMMWRWWSPYVMMWRRWYITIGPVRRIVVPSAVVITTRSCYHHKGHYQYSKKPLHRLPPMLKQNWYKHYSTFILKIQVIFKKCLTTSKTLWYNK